MSYKIYLSPPHMGGNELINVQEAFQTNWIAPYGPAIDEFEKKMAAYIGIQGALAVTSGTAAIHLVLRWLGVGKDDLVFCSDFTFIGSCAPIFYERAAPVFIDSEPESWNMSPIALEKAFRWAESRGKMPKAVLIVDLYGESADWDRLLPICRKYGVSVIEDAAEAVGTVYKEKKCGSFGDFAIQSFNGNKIITTSGGGMVLSNDIEAIEKMRFWATQAREPYIHYEHKEYGYNYRMSNVCAAIGCGQLDFLEKKLEMRRKIHRIYKGTLKEIAAHIKEHTWEGGANCWLNILYIDTDDLMPDDVVKQLHDRGIEARPTWKPMHMQPVFDAPVFFTHYDECSVDEEIFSRAVCLPSGDGMSSGDVDEIIKAVKSCF